MCGFSNNTYFSSRFRQYFSISPTEYRDIATKQEKDLD